MSMIGTWLWVVVLTSYADRQMIGYGFFALISAAVGYRVSSIGYRVSGIWFSVVPFISYAIERIYGSWRRV